ncbi:hypothetical protein AB0C38_10330 [Amycolatopsis sp. NPDC048633]|uniref:hypothetical protein n=1 Tax=Amycolatopsis sp. NPDC048633 TaxID=3157095 RepID=UPI0033E54EBB
MSGALVLCVDANYGKCGVLVVADGHIPVPELRNIHTGTVSSFADDISSLHNQTDTGICLYTNSNYWGNFLWVAKGVKLAQLASPFQDSLSSVRFGSSAC